MAQLEIIEKEDFKRELTEFEKKSNGIPIAVDLPTVATDGTIIKWNNHNVTGTELNNLVEKLQEKLQAANANYQNIYDALKGVYKTFEKLDSEYIDGIVLSIRAASEASDQAKTASSQAKSASEEAKMISEKANKASQEALSASHKADNLLDAIQKTVDVLSKFKESTESGLQNLRDKHKKEVDTIWTNIENQRRELSTIRSFKTNLEKYEHLKDVDSMWTDVGTTKKDIVTLNNFRAVIGTYEHLKDIDSLWEKENSTYQTVSNLNLNKFSKKQHITFWTAVIAVFFSISSIILTMLNML